jgi:hypothetical protein
MKTAPENWAPCERERSEGLLGLAVNLDFDVVVEFVGGVAVGVEANVTTGGALGLDQAALVGFDVGGILAGAKFGGVVVVVVIDGRDA